MKDIKGILRRASKATVLYFTYMAVTSVVPLCLKSHIFERYIQGFWTEDLYSAVSYIYSFIVLFSLVSIFVLHDREYRSRFLAAEDSVKGFQGKLGFVLTSPELWSDIFVLCALTAIIPPYTYTEMRYGFLGSVAAKWHFAIFFAVSLAAFFVFSVIAYCATLNWWARPKEKRREVLKKKDAIDWIKQVLSSIALYLAGAIALPVVIPFVWSMLLTFWMIFLTLTLLAVISVISFISFKYVRALWHRRRLVKKMKRAMRNGYCRLVGMEGIYSSVFSGREGVNIVLEGDGKRFCCKLITPLRRKHIVTFDENGWVTYEKQVVVASYFKSDKYYFDAEKGDKKILIVNPGALRIYATDGLHNRELQSGDRVMGYYVYRTDNFINAIERKYL